MEAKAASHTGVGAVGEPTGSCQSLLHLTWELKTPKWHRKTPPLTEPCLSHPQPVGSDKGHQAFQRPPKGQVAAKERERVVPSRTLNLCSCLPPNPSISFCPAAATDKACAHCKISTRAPHAAQDGEKGARRQQSWNEILEQSLAPWATAPLVPPLQMYPGVPLVAHSPQLPRGV